jgi:hypothetical protein
MTDCAQRQHAFEKEVEWITENVWADAKHGKTTSGEN